jgi:5-methylcytosine-specific restriction endonuclease McrA
MDEDTSPDENEKEDKITNQKIVKQKETSLTKGDVKKDQKDSRNIPLGLRFKVLYRDDFKCVLCGNNPPASPGLILHIDHIMPWSKGGKTEIDNLRTLCADCNIGRGNRYDD